MTFHELKVAYRTALVTLARETFPNDLENEDGEELAGFLMEVCTAPDAKRPHSVIPWKDAAALVGIANDHPDIWEREMWGDENDCDQHRKTSAREALGLAVLDAIQSSLATEWPEIRRAALEAQARG